MGYQVEAMNREILEAVKKLTAKRIIGLAEEMKAFGDGYLCYNYGSFHIDNKPYLKFVLFYFNVKDLSGIEIIRMLGNNLLNVIKFLEEEANNA